eukprot:4763901-Pleurochrysis_carterae.AAC.1
MNGERERKSEGASKRMLLNASASLRAVSAEMQIEGRDGERGHGSRGWTGSCVLLAHDRELWHWNPVDCGGAWTAAAGYVGRGAERAALAMGSTKGDGRWMAAA